jgi:hypothetical protein
MPSAPGVMVIMPLLRIFFDVTRWNGFSGILSHFMWCQQNQVCLIVSCMVALYWPSFSLTAFIVGCLGYVERREMSVMMRVT